MRPRFPPLPPSDIPQGEQQISRFTWITASAGTAWTGRSTRT